MLTSLRCAITFLSLRTNLITFLSLRTNHFSESEDLLLLLSAHVPIDCLFCDSFCQFWERLVTGIRLDFRKGFTRHSRFRLYFQMEGPAAPAASRPGRPRGPNTKEMRRLQQTSAAYRQKRKERDRGFARIRLRQETLQKWRLLMESQAVSSDSSFADLLLLT